MVRWSQASWWANHIADWLGQRRGEDVQAFLQVFRDYFFRFWKNYVVIFGLILVVSATTAGAAWLVKDIVNSVFMDKDANLLVPLISGVLAIFFLRGASTYFQIVQSTRISNAMVADIQHRLMQHILTQRTTFFDTNSSDNLLMRFNQGAQAFHSILNLVLVNGLRDFATLISLLVVMLIQDPMLTLVSFSVAPLVFYGLSVLLRRIKQFAQRELGGYQELNRLVRETVQGITVIKSFNLETTQRTEANQVIKDIQGMRDRMAALQAAPVPLLDSVGGIAIALAILYAGVRMTSGAYDAGTFMSFLTALLLAADPARRLSQMRVKLRQSFIGVNMVFDMLNSDQSEQQGSKTFPEANNAMRDRTPAIAFRGVSFAYDKKSPILRGLNLEIEPGEMVALVGPSGAGKSTLFKLLLKFHVPEAGRIEMFGTDIAELDNIALRNAVAFVGQSNFIFSGSVRDNLTLRNPEITHDRVEAACRDVGLHDHLAALPNGYDTHVGELGALISGGQAQRLNMARAIIKDAPILLLDEVTSSLDAENEELIKNYIRAQAGRKTVLVIAHRLSTVKGVDRIALVRDGTIVAHGSHDELAASNPYYEKVVALQFAA